MAEKKNLQPAHDPLGYDSPNGRRHIWPVIVWITVIWVGLWGDLSVANVLAGIAVGVFVTRVAPLPPTGRRYHPSLLGHLRFLWVLLLALVKSTTDVALRVVRSPSRLSSDIVTVKLGRRDPFVLAMAANATTLTPGTLTLDIDPETGTLTIHVLHLEPGSAESVQADTVRFADLAEAALRPTLPRVVAQE